MNKPALILAASVMCAAVALSSHAATAKMEQQPPLRKGIPETSAENFTVRKAALVQHIKDTIFRLSIEKSCVKAAGTKDALYACLHGAPVVTKDSAKPHAPAVTVTPQETPAKK